MGSSKGFVRTLPCLLAASLAACATGVRITGDYDQGATRDHNQAETAAARAIVNDQTILSVVFNDQTDPGNTLLALSPTGRSVHPGFSLFGWSYSEDGGATWIYGGKAPVPAGWAVVWGDPSATVSATNPAMVFATQLAKSSEAMPTAETVTSTSGACIFRSLDGGKTFAPFGCVANKDPTSGGQASLGHFYDGSSMTAAADGSIFAAYWDVTINGRFDVWRSPDGNSDFVRLPDPFPGHDVWQHPLLRAHRSDGSVYIAGYGKSATGGSVIWINRYKNGAWGQPRNIGPAAGGQIALQPGCIPFFGAPCSSGVDKLTLRAGNQFSFDIGHADDPAGRDAIRFLYTVLEGSPFAPKLRLAAATCDADLNACYTGTSTNDWASPPPTESDTAYFSPIVRAWSGTRVSAPVWMTSFTRRLTLPATAVHFMSARLEYVPGTIQRVFTPIVQSDSMPICPDGRGYWGDFDDLIVAGFVATERVRPPQAEVPGPRSEPRWLRTVSDSRSGCVKRWALTSAPVHVTGLLFK